MSYHKKSNFRSFSTKILKVNRLEPTLSAGSKAVSVKLLVKKTLRATKSRSWPKMMVKMKPIDNSFTSLLLPVYSKYLQNLI